MALPCSRSSSAVPEISTGRTHRAYSLSFSTYGNRGLAAECPHGEARDHGKSEITRGVTWLMVQPLRVLASSARDPWCSGRRSARRCSGVRNLLGMRPEPRAKAASAAPRQGEPRRDPLAATACRNFGMQSRSHSGHGFGGSEDGLGGPSMSITTAARSAIHGPNMKCTLR